MANDDNGTTPSNGEQATSTTLPAPSPPWYRRRFVLAATLLVLGLFLLYHFTRAPPKAAGGRGQQGNPFITVEHSRTGNMAIFAYQPGQGLVLRERGSIDQAFGH